MSKNHCFIYLSLLDHVIYIFCIFVPLYSIATSENDELKTLRITNSNSTSNEQEEFEIKNTITPKIKYLGRSLTK